MLMLRRSAWLRLWIALCVVLAMGSGCGGTATEPPIQVTPPKPTIVEDLPRLCVAAGLKWMVLLRPREIAQIPWLIPAIGRVVPEARFDAYEDQTGLDLRQVKELIVAGYADGEGGTTTLLLVRHSGRAELLEAAAKKRMTRELVRSVDRHDVVRVSGLAGTERLSFARIGHEVVAYQYGGSSDEGPARIAALRAMGKLEKPAPALSGELLDLRERFGSAPAIALLPGPFEGDWSRGARGLLGAATAVGGALRPTVREGIGLAIALTGEFSGQTSKASEILVEAYQDIALGSLGRMLGLAVPVEAPLATHTDSAIAVAVELDPDRISAGLADFAELDVDRLLELSP